MSRLFRLSIYLKFLFCRILNVLQIDEGQGLGQSVFGDIAFKKPNLTQLPIVVVLSVFTKRKLYTSRIMCKR